MFPSGSHLKSKQTKRTIFKNDKNTQANQNQRNDHVTIGRENPGNMPLIRHSHPDQTQQHDQQQEDCDSENKIGQGKAGKQGYIDTDVITAIGKGDRGNTVCHGMKHAF